MPKIPKYEIIPNNVPHEIHEKVRDSSNNAENATQTKNCI